LPPPSSDESESDSVLSDSTCAMLPESQSLVNPKVLQDDAQE